MSLRICPGSKSHSFPSKISCAGARINFPCFYSGNPIDEDVTGETMDPVTGMTGDTGSPTGSAKPVTFVPGTSSMIPISIVTGGTPETTENPSPMTGKIVQRGYCRSCNFRENFIFIKLRLKTRLAP